MREFELYFEALDHANPDANKRPDLLVFPAERAEDADAAIAALGGPVRLPFVPEGDPGMRRLLDLAVVAVECENSLWVARRMPDFAAPLRPQRRLGGAPGLRKNAVLPTVIVKDEDLPRLRDWERTNGLPIHVWHSFFDLSWGIALAEIARLVALGAVEPSVQVFQAPGGQTTEKALYKVPYRLAYPLGEATEEPTLAAHSHVEPDGEITLYPEYQGGAMRLESGVIERMLG